MRVGSLRYPGGTVANYWYMPNATFALPCEHPGKHSNATGAEGVVGGHNKCAHKRNVDVWNAYTSRGRQTMKNFYEGFGMASPTANKRGPLWVINMLTVKRDKVRCVLPLLSCC